MNTAKGEENAAAGESGSVQHASGGTDPGICALVFGLSLYRGTGILESLMFAVALAVAAIPEALGSIVTIVQAMGTAADGSGTRHHQGSESGGEPGLRVGDLLR